MGTRQTALFDLHLRLGAKMIPFAGYEMPVQYTGIVEEHRRVRTTAGVFDVSHMGEIEVSGPEALGFLQRVTVNDAGKLTEGRVQYSAMCYESGGIIDDLLVYHLGDRYMLVVNAANIRKDMDWLREHAGPGVQITDRSEDTALVAVQGPASVPTLRKISAADPGQQKYYHAVQTNVAGVPVLMSRTGYTGEVGFELYINGGPPGAVRVWEAVFEAGRGHGIGPAGLGARDTLRLEMGYCLYGNDIDETTNPIEAGLGWITKTDKGDFLGREAIVRAKEEGPERLLAGFEVEGRAFPRHGYTIRSGGRDIGHVTSGTFSPTLERGIGLGYLERAFAAPGTPLSVVIRNREIAGKVVQLPFVKK